MVKRSIEDRIAQLEARKKSLKARLSKQERTNDTRRKVLIGAFLLERLSDAKAAAREPKFTADLKRWVSSDLPDFLTRPNDRALFPEWIVQTDTEEADAHIGTSLANGSDVGGAFSESTRTEAGEGTGTEPDTVRAGDARFPSNPDSGDVR